MLGRRRKQQQQPPKQQRVRESDSESEEAERQQEVERTIVVDHGDYSSSCGYCRGARGSSHSHVQARVEGALNGVLEQWREQGLLPASLLLPAVTLRSVPVSVRARVGEGKGGERGEGGKKKGGKIGKGKGGEEGAGGAGESQEKGVSAPLPVLTSNIAFLICSGLKKLLQQQQPGVTTAQQSASREGVGTSAFSLSSSAQDFAAKLVAEADGALQSGGLPEGVCVRAMHGHVNVLVPAALLHGGGMTTDMHYEQRQQNQEQKQPEKQQQQQQQEKQPQQDQQRQRQRHMPRRLEITTHPSAFTQEEYDLYRKYQIHVHDDKPSSVTRRGYENFLVNTPLIHVPPPPAPPTSAPPTSLPSCGYGSFHQQYRIDGRLVAVGVVDVLPRCLSSKYLFWDPDYAFLSLGKFSALKEIEWVQREQQQRPDLLLDSYYMGYYIHSCPKMTYKAAYAPSDLLCPLRYM
ncbi:unnamed protein product [Closterium sp. NIES-54]